jgi:hypothetical protein
MLGGRVIAVMRALYVRKARQLPVAGLVPMLGVCLVRSMGGQEVQYTAIAAAPQGRHEQNGDHCLFQHRQHRAREPASVAIVNPPSASGKMSTILQVFPFHLCKHG